MDLQPVITDFYPPIEPFESGWFATEDGHNIYWERVGRRGGFPAVFVHGGPGGRVDPFHRQLFNPELYDVLLFDQRGCGRSLPRGGLENNTLWHLVRDIESLRRDIMHTDQWAVIGGSWGSLLALAYAQQHPASVHSMVLRGIFLGSAQEMDWFYRSGLDHIYPDAWLKFLAPLAHGADLDPVTAYWEILNGSDEKAAISAAKAWNRFEQEVSSLVYNEASDEPPIDVWMNARIQIHFFRNNCFLRPGELLESMPKLASTPATLIHGRYDMTCPLKFAWQVHEAWPSAEFHIIPSAGHDLCDAGILKAVTAAIARLVE